MATMAWGWVVVVGSFDGGLAHVFGPFPNQSEADTFAGYYRDRMDLDGATIVRQMESPEHETDRDDLVIAYLSEAMKLVAGPYADTKRVSERGA